MTDVDGTMEPASTPVVELDRLRLCPLTAADAEEMAEVLAAPELYAFIGGGPPTPAELRERYLRWARGAPDPGTRWLNWVIRLRADKRAIGTVQATVRLDTPSGPEACLAWIIGAPWQNAGYAKEAARGTATLLRATGVHRLSARVHPRHRASAAVASAVGLTPTSAVVDGEIRWTNWRQDGP